MLGKIASARQNGQFRTPRHIIQLMVELTQPTPQDVICDPASGTCGFLVAAGEYLRAHHKGLFQDAALNRHFHAGMFHGYDFDQTMLRIGSMNMQLHGVEAADIEELRQMLLDAEIGESQHLEAASLLSTGFAGFLRSLIGLDRQAIAALFSEFLEDAAASAQQIEFLDMVIEHLTANGAMPPGLLYESPFTDMAPSGPEQVFTLPKAQRLVAIIDKVNASVTG